MEIPNLVESESDDSDGGIDIGGALNIDISSSAHFVVRPAPKGRARGPYERKSVDRSSEFPLFLIVDPAANNTFPFFH